MKPSYYIVKDNPTDETVRFFVIGYFINNKFTGMMHDYIGGGEYQEHLIVEDKFLPFTDVDDELYDWEDTVTRFEQLSKVRYTKLEEDIHNIIDYSTDLFNYILLPEFDNNLIDGTVYINNCTGHIPYGLGNTSFPLNGYVIEIMPNITLGADHAKYKVRLEFDVVSTDYADITVEANSAEEAKAEAIRLYHDDAYLDYYSSDYIDTNLSDNIEDWECTKLP